VTEGATYDQRRLAGRAVRARVPRSAHEAWQPPDDRPDPIELLAENNLPRLPDLVPVRYGRMLASPFAFLRGSAVIMASDLASTPVTGLRVQACGDAHLGNFGMFATPERNLIFDVNDFDETHPGPWEWDLKRLAVSVILAAGNLQIDAGQAAAFAAATVRAYRERMAELAVMGPLDAWYDRIDVAAVLTLARQRRAKDLQRQLSTAKLRHRTSLHVLPKLTRVVNGTRKIIDDPRIHGHRDAVRRVDHGIRPGLRRAGPARLRRSGRRGRVRPDHRGQGLVSGASAGGAACSARRGSLAGDRGCHPGPFGMKNGTPAAGYAREFTRRRYAQC
jgi:hypothetical protein